MKTKKKNKNRIHNELFNVHTVTGITISVALFICFLAGAFALFMDNIDHWEGNVKNNAYDPKIDYERLLEVTEGEGYDLDNRNIQIRYYEGATSYIQINALPPKLKDAISIADDAGPSRKDSLAMANVALRIHPETYEVLQKNAEFGDESLGTFLYHLHYFNQIPNLGFYLSALVSLFFLLAIVTGTIVHWKKIVSNFFTFRLKGSLKNLWTDAHTSLGIIGLPFQFMYALTGAFFGLALLVFLPMITLVYDGDQDRMTKDVFPGRTNYEVLYEPLEGRLNINDLVAQSMEDLGRDDLANLQVSISAYNDKNAHLSINVFKSNINQLVSYWHTTYRLSDGKVVNSKAINETSYNDGFVMAFFNLHFANFGGYFLKFIYFILALITCFVILSGVMIWLEARNTKKYEHKKRFNTNVGAIYLGASLGLLPAIAFLFCMTKVFPLEMEGRFGTMSIVFFLFWLCYTIYAFFLKDFHKINKHALLVTGILGILILLLNGIQSGLWPWKSLPHGYIDSFFVDVSWLVMGSISLWAGLRVKRLVAHKKQKRQDAGQQAHETV